MSDERKERVAAMYWEFFVESSLALGQTRPMGDSAIDIDNPTPDQRLELVEHLWDSLTPDDVPITTPQRAELKRRLDRLDRDGVSGRSWDEVERRIRNRRQR